MTRTKGIKPNFIVIGAGKAGSTSLCTLLAQHPHIFVSKPKEPRFFSLDENFHRGWEWYESFFKGAETALAIGEGSVNYTMRTAYPNTSERIAKSLPEAKLIYIVRHPLERIVSNWRMGAWMHKDFPAFNQAVREESLRPLLIDRSKYWFQISAYRDYFLDERIMVLFLKELQSNPCQVLQRCYEFLGVDSVSEPSQIGGVYNTAEKRQAERPLISRLRRLPIFNTVSHILPINIRKRVKNFLMRKGPGIPKWETKTRKWAIEQLIEDTHTFLEFYGKPIDFWSLD